MQKTLIITAMGEEAEHIINFYNLQKIKEFKDISIFEGDNIVLALAGIGKIQSTIATTYLLENFEVKNIINIGIAGNLKGHKYHIGDVFLVTKIFQHDMYLPFEGSHLDYAKADILLKNKTNIKNDFGFNLHHNGYCLTGDQFIDNKEKVEELVKKFDADVIEMEAFAIASVAREYNQLDKCIFIKSISDGADSKAGNDHMFNLDIAMQNGLEVLKKLI